MLKVVQISKYAAILILCLFFKNPRQPVHATLLGAFVTKNGSVSHTDGDEAGRSGASDAGGDRSG